MDKFMSKFFGYALLGLVSIMIIWQFAWYAVIGIIIFGAIYYGFKRAGNSLSSVFKKKEKKS
jgi:hypothetical protein